MRWLVYLSVSLSTIALAAVGLSYLPALQPREPQGPSLPNPQSAIGNPQSGDVPSTQVVQVAQPKPAVKTKTAPLAAKPVAPPPAPAPKPVDPSDDFFNQGRIPQIKIYIQKKEEDRLRADNRRFVECSFTEDGKTTFRKVGVKLKGAAGSFRGFDDRPALTLKMKKDDERFHGMDKFHLNNSVQDESYLSELLCSQISNEAGCPAARVSHARVWLNDRDLGFYVLKEGFDRPFLARHFGDPKGNLYDGGFCVEIDTKLEKDSGEGPEDHSDLTALVAACREPDEKKRWALIAERLDVPAFLNFNALELMMCHWDGYVQNRNNYRVYFRTSDKKAVFMPHGMDQMFQDGNFGVFHRPPALVANVTLSNPEWQELYRQRVKELLPLFASTKLHAKIDVIHARLRPVLASMHEDRARQFDERVREFKGRVAQRQQNIRNQMPPEPVSFKNGPVAIDAWDPRPQGDAKLEEKEVAGKICYVIETGPSKQCQSSFRRKVLLPKGSYRLEAQAQAQGIEAIGDDKGKGLGLRLGGGMRQNQLAGTTSWQKIAHEFEVAEEMRDVELVLELRSTAGRGIVEASSLKIVKVK